MNFLGHVRILGIIYHFNYIKHSKDIVRRSVHMEAIILDDIINNTYVVLYLIHGPLDHLFGGLTHDL